MHVSRIIHCSVENEYSISMLTMVIYSRCGQTPQHFIAQ